MAGKLAIIVVAVLGLSIAIFVTNPSSEIDATGGDMNLGTTLYVGGSGPGNYSSIQNAIDDASDGDTVFVYDDSSPYYENIEVDKSITLEGENRDTTVIDGGGTGDVARVSDDWVNISGFTIQNSGSNWNDKGIEIHSNHNTISWSIITNNNDGIYLMDCSNNAISNCDCYNNLYGIWIWLHSSNNDITNCAIYNNSYDGIYIRDSSNNNISNCNIYNNIDQGIWLYNSSNNNISNCNIYDNSRAIYLRDFSNNNTISNCNCYNNLYGIRLYFSLDNLISRCTIYNNDYWGIYLDSSSNNLIYNNYFNNTDNAWDNDYNYWNITKTLGTNIIGGPYLGGNYWPDYAGNDTDGDGLGDTLLPYNCSGNIKNGGDWLPLVPVAGDITPPEISNVQDYPDPQEIGGWVNISCNVMDNVKVNEVYLNITYPEGNYENFSIKQNKTGNTYYCNKTYSQIGTYNYFIWTTDISGNENISDVYHFEIIPLPDITPPEISNVTDYPDPQEAGKWVNITCNVTDNVGVDTVKVNITYPDSSHINQTMANIAGTNKYYHNTTYTTLGTYSYFIWANDTSDNENTSATYTFTIQDTTSPTSNVDSISPYWQTSAPFMIMATASDIGSDVATVELFYRYSADNSSWGDWLSFGVDDDGTWSWSFTAPNGDGYYQFYSIANDTLGNEESSPEMADAIAGVDATESSIIGIERPRGCLYIFDRKIIPLPSNITMIIGKITIEVNATDEISGIDKVEFFIDGKSKHNETTFPYEWLWDETVFFRHTIKVVAYDVAGNTASDEQVVCIFNL